MKVLDLEKFAPDDREIHLNGKVIMVPGDLPMGIMLKVLKNSELTDQVEIMEQSVEMMIEILNMKDGNEVDRDWIERLSRDQFLKLQNFVLGNLDTEGDAGEKKAEETEPSQ